MKYGTGSILAIISTMWKNDILSTKTRNEKVQEWSEIMKNGTGSDAVRFCKDMIDICPEVAGRWKDTLREIAGFYEGEC